MEVSFIIRTLLKMTEKYSWPSLIIGCWESVGPCSSSLYGESLKTIRVPCNCMLSLIILLSCCCWMFVPSFVQALRCIGSLVLRNPQNLDSLASKQVGEEPHVQPALNVILAIILRTSIAQEFVAADYVFKCFCEVIFFLDIFAGSNDHDSWTW